MKMFTLKGIALLLIKELQAHKRRVVKKKNQKITKFSEKNKQRFLTVGTNNGRIK